MKTQDLTGAALDWAVAKCEGHKVNVGFRNLTYTPKGKRTLYNYAPSTNWAQGGPIIEREIFKVFRNVGGKWTAQLKRRIPYYSPTYDADIGTDEIVSVAGETALIAAMRCYVRSKLGDEVEIPEELK
jgi:hypothetical protein